jgi:hypothetical protein
MAKHCDRGGSLTESRLAQVFSKRNKLVPAPLRSFDDDPQQLLVGRVKTFRTHRICQPILLAHFEVLISGCTQFSLHSLLSCELEPAPRKSHLITRAD